MDRTEWGGPHSALPFAANVPSAQGRHSLSFSAPDSLRWVAAGQGTHRALSPLKKPPGPHNDSVGDGEGWAVGESEGTEVGKGVGDLQTHKNASQFKFVLSVASMRTRKGQ
jgi:hypothetical protein